MVRSAGQELYDMFGYLAIAGNIIFILWMTYNGIDEKFQATRLQIFSYVGLTILLLLNSFLVYRNQKR